eukprot:g64189.t1
MKSFKDKILKNLIPYKWENIKSASTGLQEKPDLRGKKPYSGKSSLHPAMRALHAVFALWCWAVHAVPSTQSPSGSVAPKEEAFMRCPVSGEPINEDVFLDFNYDNRIYFAETSDLMAFIWDPLAYMVDVSKDIDPDRIELPADFYPSCVITGEPVEIDQEESAWEAVIFEYGQCVFFCCPMCTDRFLQNPLASLYQPNATKPQEQYEQDRFEFQQEQEQSRHKARLIGIISSTSVLLFLLLASLSGLYIYKRRRLDNARSNATALQRLCAVQDEGQPENDEDEPLDDREEGLLSARRKGPQPLSNSNEGTGLESLFGRSAHPRAS